MLMRVAVSLITCLLAFSNAFSQSYDLLVTTRGDSIACRIDSISGNKVYFEMKFHDVWIHTELLREECSAIRPGELEKDLIIFQPGTSYIESIIDLSDQENLMSIYRKNTLYGGIGFFFIFAVADINYERLITVPGKGFIKSCWIRAGSGSYVTWGGQGRMFILGLTMLSGAGNNHIEFNLGYSSLFEKNDYKYALDDYIRGGSIYPTKPVKSRYRNAVPFVGTGYRFQKPGGHFIFRTGFSIPESAYLGMGFSF